MKLPLTFAEFFAGIGLMRLGLEATEWKCKFANDIDLQKREMYEAQFPDSHKHFVLNDIHLLDPATIPQVSLATASFPCNDLSLAGGRAGLKGEQSSAYWGFIKILKALGTRRPALVLLENVVGFLSSHGGKDFKSALVALNDLGYRVDPILIDAARFVPQSRQRLFVIATHESLAEFTDSCEEQAAFYQSDVRPSQLADFIFNNPDINWNIRQLPSLPKSSKAINSILENVSLQSELWWSEERAKYLLNQMSSRHRALAESMIQSKSILTGTVFRRVRNGRSMAELRTDGIAGCLRTPRGGSGRQILFVAGRGQYKVRLLTPRECARLMGANDYKITVPSNQALFGFGDAVCVPVIKWISQNYLRPVLSSAGRQPRSIEDAYANA